jgi:hypothetical protein
MLLAVFTADNGSMTFPPFLYLKDNNQTKFLYRIPVLSAETENTVPSRTASQREAIVVPH